MTPKKTFTIIALAFIALSVLYFIRANRLAATAATAEIAAMSGISGISPIDGMSGISPVDSMSGMKLWQGIWVSEKTKKTGDFQVAFQQEGENIMGSIKIGGSSITKGGEIKGTINGDRLEFGLVKDKKGELKYVGTISENIMSGTWDIPVIKDHGTWQAIKEESEPSTS